MRWLEELSIVFSLHVINSHLPTIELVWHFLRVVLAGWALGVQNSIAVCGHTSPGENWAGHTSPGESKRGHISPGRAAHFNILASRVNMTSNLVGPNKSFVFIGGKSKRIAA